MKVLELFAGSRSFSKVAEELEHKTYTTDIEPFDKIDQVCNIFDFDVTKMVKDFGKPDIIWASPPCTTFSVASIGSHYTGGKNAYIPKTKEAEIGIQIVEHTIKLIANLKPKFWYIENPRGVLRKLPVMNCNYNKYLPTEIRFGIANILVLKKQLREQNLLIFGIMILNGLQDQFVKMVILIVITKEHQEGVELEHRD